MDSWHSRPQADLFQELDARPGGLTRRQAEERLARYGPNQLEPPRRPGLLSRVMAQMKDPMILVLLGAAGLSLAASRGEDWLDAAIILVIVVVNNIISISQEDHAHRALEELRKMTSPHATALRGGAPVRVEAAELVPGDVILLEAGDLVPADARLLEAAGLRCDESAMTGESVPVEKAAGGPLPEDAPLGDWTNMVISGTLVTAGRATALVTATGMDTQMGRIAGLLLEGETQPTPLQRKMGEISRSLSFLCLSVCAVMFGVGLLQGKDMLGMFLTAVSLAVAAIPEGLPAIVTIVLALGVGRMADRGAIVKKLPAVETLGCASVICSDKTGTLTQNRMTVRELWVPAGGHRRDALLAGALCGDARLEWKAGAPASAGDPTEGALVVAAAREGLDRNQLSESLPRTGEIPFDSGRKLMTTVHEKEGGGRLVLVKGAPDVLLERCVSGPRGPLSPADRRQILAANEDMARRALRVIGVARRELSLQPRKLESGTVERDLTFLGLFGMADPPRREVKGAVERCHQAGIRPVMITGDHRATAMAVARELDICRPGDLALTGPELDFMPQEMLEEDIEKFAVFARVSPEHKMRIVRAWQKKGRVVAMTGDGVNDAPALKAADIGCAMGLSGTDVAKGAAEMILTDDNFSTIVQAVEEGVMDQPPRAPSAGLFSRGFSLRLAWQGLMVGGLTLGAYLLGLFHLGAPGMEGAAANTMAFATLTLSQLFHAFNVRSEDQSLLAQGALSNPAMNKAFLAGMVMQLSVLLLPPLQGVFSVCPMDLTQWVTVLALAMAPIPICEAEKALRRRRPEAEEPRQEKELSAARK